MKQPALREFREGLQELEIQTSPIHLLAYIIKNSLLQMKKLEMPDEELPRLQKVLSQLLRLKRSLFPSKTRGNLLSENPVREQTSKVL